MLWKGALWNFIKFQIRLKYQQWNRCKVSNKSGEWCLSASNSLSGLGWLPSVNIYFIWPKMTIICNLTQSYNSEIHVQGIGFFAVPDNDSALICGRTSSAEIISKHIPMYLWTIADNKCRADSRLAPSQWVMSLQSNVISDWLDTNL